MPNIVDHANRSYVALKVLKVGVNDDGTPIYRDRGDHVPEANDWPANAVAALLHTQQLGEGPTAEALAVTADLRERIERLESRVEALATERDALRDQRDTAEAQVRELETAQVALETAPVTEAKTVRLPAPTPIPPKQAKE